MLSLFTFEAVAGMKEFLFGLDGDNTAYDYMTAPNDRAVSFLMDLCKGGTCLNKRDWYCGFDNNADQRKVMDCFTGYVSRVPPWVKLDVIRKFCGVNLAQFTGELYGNKKKCADAGGNWGVKSAVTLPQR